MTVPSSNYFLVLQQVSNNQQYLLSKDRVLSLGRDPNCEIVFDSNTYQGVSRRHAEIRPSSPSTASGLPRWEVRDLGGMNGTFVNGQRLQSGHILKIGDRLMLGENGPELVFDAQELAANLPPLASIDPRPPVTAPVSTVSLSQLLPAFSPNLNLRQKGFLVPGIITVIAVVLMFATMGTSNFLYVLGFYIAIGSYYAIYRLCGKSKPWWLLVGAALFTIVFLCTPLVQLFILVFRKILPGDVRSTSNFAIALINNFFGAGMMEELIKAIPVFIALGIGAKLKFPWREKIGVWEPLDGIIIGTASAVGFTLLETLGQYVPKAIAQSGTTYGLMLLIPRVLGQVAGHAAYSGYFGYFIGLSVLKPQQRWQILGIGYLSSSLLHGLWNSISTLSDNAIVSTTLQTGVGILSYICLVGAILKARQLSPSRAQNFATQIKN
jgi:RsiW-degrading membrane proteinase PrsW (M82 family)